jgi:phage tail sheath protein FI
MPVYQAPGVYVIEEERGPKSIQGAGTSTAAFIGICNDGPPQEPTPIDSFDKFEAVFGGIKSAKDTLGYAVRGFFDNGGRMCYVVRIGNAERSKLEVKNRAKDKDKIADLFTLKSATYGEAGDSTRVTLKSSGAPEQVFLDKNKPANGDVRVTVDDPLPFFPGSVVRINRYEKPGTPPKEKAAGEHFDLVVGKSGNELTLHRGIPQKEFDLAKAAKVTIASVEFDLTLDAGAVVEKFEGLGFFPGHPDYFVRILRGSKIVTLEVPEVGTLKPDDVSSDGSFLPDEIEDKTLGGGADDDFKKEPLSGLLTKVIGALERVPDISIVAFPGQTDKGMQEAVIAHCEKMKYRVAVLDGLNVKNPEDALKRRNEIGSDTGHAALYYPWLKVRDDATGETITIPPSGHVAGIYARTDTERGVHKAPANEKLRNIVGLSYTLTFAENETLNPAGVNCLRAFPGQGSLVWGARTISKNPSWMYVNVRRLFAYLESSIERSTSWVVFEPNDEKLWARVRQTITNFLTTTWRDGALMGSTPEEAFFVRCDRTTMTQDDIDNGRLICVIGVAPVKPAEFVIFKISQWPGGSAVTE